MACLKSKKVDLLLVVDDLDFIKMYMLRIKDSLSTLKPEQIILTRSIFDLDNEKTSLRCKKVLFLISNTTKSLETKVEFWCKQLPLIKGSSKQFLIINYGKEQDSLQTPFPVTSIICLENLSDISYWWPDVLKFLYGKNWFRIRFKESDFFVLNLSANDGEACKVFDRVTAVLEQAKLTKGTDESNTESIIVVLTNPADLEIQRHVQNIKEQCKSRNQSLHIICTHHNKHQLSNYIDSVYNRDEFLKLILWLHVDLGLINANRKDIQTRIQQNVSKERLLKVVGAVLWLTVGLPIMLFFACLGFAVILTVIAVVFAVVVAVAAVVAVVGAAVVIISKDLTGKENPCGEDRV